MQYIRRTTTDEGNPEDPEIIGLVKYLKHIFIEQECAVNINKWLGEENCNLKSKAIMWFIVNVTTLMKGTKLWLGYYYFKYWKMYIKEFTENEPLLIEKKSEYLEMKHHIYADGFKRHLAEENLDRWFNKPVFKKKRRCFMKGFNIYTKHSPKTELIAIAKLFHLLKNLKL
jgi:hypothetical protein